MTSDEPSPAVPGVVFVHGLWHGAWTWDAVRAPLATAGIYCVAVELPLTDLPAGTEGVVRALETFGRPS